MVETLAENLSDMSIMGSDGTELGRLHNITMNLQTGSLVALHVTPRDSVSPEEMPFERTDTGRFRVPADRVQAVKDYIVVRN